MGDTIEHFNIFNTGEESFFTPGRQLANIAAVKPGGSWSSSPTVSPGI